MKWQCLLNKKRYYFWFRMKQRKGSLIYFLLAKLVGKKESFDKTKGHCLIWEYKQHRFLTQDNKLQTYIKLTGEKAKKI